MAETGQVHRDLWEARTRPGQSSITEAANFAIRFSPRIKSFYQRKKFKSNAIVAIKAVAHKLCRACYYIMKDQVPFDITKAFT